MRRLVDEYFIENRTRLLDLAAFLDRLDRAADSDPKVNGQTDFRIEAFQKALLLLCGEGPDRVLQIQAIFSDPTSEPLDRFDQKGACGAYDNRSEEKERR
jgi:hypothetical protein